MFARKSWQGDGECPPCFAAGLPILRCQKLHRGTNTGNEAPASAPPEPRERLLSSRRPRQSLASQAARQKNVESGTRVGGFEAEVSARDGGTN